MRMHTPQTLRQIVEIDAAARRAVHRRRGDDRRRPHRNAVGASGRRHRSRSRLRGEDADRRRSAAGGDVGSPQDRRGFPDAGSEPHVSFTAIPSPPIRWPVRSPFAIIGSFSQSRRDAPERMERFWTQALTPLRDHPRVKEVRIRGSIAAIEIDAAGGYLADIGAAMRRACLQRGVFLRPLGSVLYAMPPFCTSPASLAADRRRHDSRGGNRRLTAKDVIHDNP